MQAAYDKLRAALSVTYEHRAEVYRNTTTKDPESRESQFALERLFDLMPCRVSQNALPANGQTSVANNIDATVKLFYPPGHAIQQGDEIRVNGRAYIAGVPFDYPSHSELVLQFKGWA